MVQNASIPHFGVMLTFLFGFDWFSAFGAKPPLAKIRFSNGVATKSESGVSEVFWGQPPLFGSGSFGIGLKRGQIGHTCMCFPAQPKLQKKKKQGRGFARNFEKNLVSYLKRALRGREDVTLRFRQTLLAFCVFENARGGGSSNTSTARKTARYTQILGFQGYPGFPPPFADCVRQN